MFTIKSTAAQIVSACKALQAPYRGIAEYPNGPLKIVTNVTEDGTVVFAALMKQSDGSWFYKGRMGLLTSPDKITARLIKYGYEEIFPYKPEDYRYTPSEEELTSMKKLQEVLYHRMEQAWEDARNILFTEVILYKDTFLKPGSKLMEDDNIAFTETSRIALFDYYLKGAEEKDRNITGFSRWIQEFTVDDTISFVNFARKNGDIITLEAGLPEECEDYFADMQPEFVQNFMVLDF